MSGPVTNHPTQTPAAASAKQTPLWATENFIRTQRIIGVAMIALGILASAMTGGLAVPLVALGAVVIGASLIQQVVGNTPGCEKAQGRRALAGAFIMTLGPIGWIVGGILWHLSNKANEA